MFRKLSFLLAFSFCLADSSFAARQVATDAPLGMVTGPKTGTYYAFGKDVAESAKKVGLTIDVKASEGSIDNIKRINSTENAAFGIVQSDVLGFLSRSKNPDSMKMASNLRMIFPFYNEEVHVLARKEIKAFTDLQGKRIAVGEDGSGNMLTSVNLFSLMGVVPSETRKIPSAQGVVAVLKGELDAVIFVGGKPVRLFKNLEDLNLPENKKYEGMLGQVHFLPMDDRRMLAEYKAAEISKNDYNFVGDTVPTISVQAVLVSFNFSGSSIRRCDKVAKLAKDIRDSLPGLKEKGHPKWKEVNLDAEMGYWQKDECAWANVSTSSVSSSNSLGSDLISIIEKEKSDPVKKPQ